MKLLWIAACLLASAGATAQTLGAKLGTELRPPVYYEGLVVSPQIGVFFEQPVIGRLGFAAGAEYAFAEYRPVRTSTCCFMPCPVRADVTAHTVQVPLALTYDVFRSKSGAWKGTLVYSVQPLADVHYKTTAYYSDQSIRKFDRGALNYSDVPAVRVPVSLGFELRRSLACGCNNSLTFGGAVSPNVRSLGSDFNHPVDAVSFYLKSGFSLKKQP